MATLEERVAALEEAVAADAQSDQLFPNVLTVAADGTIGADFTGHVHAKGLDLDAATVDPAGAPAAVNLVRWLNANGIDVADAAGAEYLTPAGGGNFNTIRKAMLRAFADSSLVRNFATISLRVSDVNAVDQTAEITASTGPLGASVGAAVAGNLPTFMDDQGRSSFLQLLTLAKAQVQFGTRPAVVSDGGGWCNYTLPAAFPTALDFVLAMNSFAGANGSGFLDVQTVDAGHFRAWLNQVGISCSCMYIAIGH